MQLQPFTVEYLAPGLISERSVDGLLTIFIIGSAIPRLDILEAQITRLLMQLNAHTPCLLLYDLHKANPFALNPIQAQLAILRRTYLYVSWYCYIAFVVAEGNADTSIVLDESIARFSKAFVSRHEALIWLLAQITGEP